VIYLDINNGAGLVAPGCMARRPRLQYPGAVYHVMSRGNRKLPIFEDDCDRECLLAILAYTAKRYGIRCYALCFMSNHYHLVFDTPRGNLSDAMRQVNGVYAQAYNRRHHLTGHVFEGRFRSIVVQGTLYLRRVARYVVRNPLRARLVASASDWRWSSHRAMLGLDPVPTFLHTDWIETAFPSESRDQSRRRYEAFVNSPITKRLRFDVNAPVLGSARFQSAVRELAARTSDCPLPAMYRKIGRPSLSSLFATNGLPLTRSSRNERICDAHETHGYHLSEIARFVGLHPSTATGIFRRYERRRASDANPQIHEAV
jgi:putative transposase